MALKHKTERIKKGCSITRKTKNGEPFSVTIRGDTCTEADLRRAGAPKDTIKMFRQAQRSLGKMRKCERLKGDAQLRCIEKMVGGALPED